MKADRPHKQYRLVLDEQGKVIDKVDTGLNPMISRKDAAFENKHQTHFLYGEIKEKKTKAEKE